MAKKALRAAQEPRIDIYVSGETRKADLLFDLLDEYGMHLLDWQKLVLRRWLAEDDDGKFVNLTCGLSVPRQNGKTEIIVARIIYGIIFRKAHGYFCAQQQDTADVVKKRVQDFFYNTPYEEIFNLLTPRFRQKPRNYAFMEFENGAYYQFQTRTRLGGLGTTNDELIFDEAADVLDQHESTLLPTISAAKTRNPQVIYCGTPPMAETVGAVFGRVRGQILSGAKGSWTEWGTEHLTSKDDVEAWYKNNPSLGTFLLPSVLEAESRSLSTDDFNRMRLGWWSGVEDKRAIPQKTWDALYTEKPDFDDSYMPIYAVKFAPDRSDYSLVVSQPLKDGKVHVEVVLQRPISEGFARLSKWLIERYQKCSRIIIDGVVGQAILLEDLKSGGVPLKKIIQPNMKEIVAAHQFMQDAIDNKELSHYNQPLLNQTVRVTKQRQMGRYGGFGWDSMSKTISTCALDAATFALWGQKVFAQKQMTEDDIAKNNQKWHDILSSL